MRRLLSGTTPAAPPTQRDAATPAAATRDAATPAAAAPDGAHPAHAVAVLVGGLDESAAYALHPKVALRPERFGALAYSYATRRLSMVRDADLVAVLHELAGQPSAGAALDAAPPAKRAALARALGRLVETGFVHVRDPAAAGRPPTFEGTP